MGIHERLKIATAPLHDRIEARNPLSRETFSLKEYEQVMHATYQIVAPLESAVESQCDWANLGIDLNLFQRAELLRQDLESLGSKSPQEDCDLQLPSCNSTAEALGVMYVLEGSRLGGQYLAKKISVLHGDKLQNTMRYLKGSGALTGSHWRSFLSILVQYSIQYPDQDPSILKSAIETFECFEHKYSRLAI